MTRIIVPSAPRGKSCVLQSFRRNIFKIPDHKFPPQQVMQPPCIDSMWPKGYIIYLQYRHPSQKASTISTYAPYAIAGQHIPLCKPCKRRNHPSKPFTKPQSLPLHPYPSASTSLLVSSLAVTMSSTSRHLVCPVLLHLLSSRHR